MLSPFVILILALPLAATDGFADPQLFRWAISAATALLVTFLALRSGKIKLLGSRRRLVRILFALALVPALFIATAPADSMGVLTEFARLIIAAGLGILAALSLGPLAAQRLAPLQAAAPALLLLADRAIRGGLWPVDLAIHSSEITSTFGNTALVGECALMSLPFLLLAMVRKSRVAATALVLGLGAPLVWLLVVSDSRGAWLGAGATLVIWLAFGRRNTAVTVGDETAPNRGPALLALALVVIALGLAAFLGRVDPVARLASILDPDHPTNRVRIELWRDGVDMGLDHLLTGVGLGRFGAEHGRYRGAAEWRISGLGSRVEDPHNEFVRIFAESGLVGLVLALGGLALLLRGLLRRQGSPGPAGDAARAALAAWAGFLVMSMTWGCARHPAALVPLAILSALALRERKPGPQTEGGRSGLVFAGLIAAAFAVILLQAEREGNAVDLRDRAEELKRQFARPEADMANKVQVLMDLGQVGRALSRAASSDLIGPDLRHRLLITIANLAEQGLVVTAGLSERGELDESLRMLENAAATLPEPEMARKVAAFQLERAPAYLPTRLVLARLDRVSGRKPEAIFALEDLIAFNPDEPEARLLLADLYVEGGTGRYDLAAGLLEDQVARYPRLQPVADRAFEQLARCQGAGRKIDLALATVDRWIEHCGEGDARRAVGGELALHFGETDETLGRFLADQEEWARRQERGAFRVGELAGLPLRESVEAFLAHLGRYPNDTPIIVALGEALSAEGRDDPSTQGMKNRALALGRCHFAWEALLLGDPGRLAVHLRIARGKNPESGDPFLVEAVAQAKSGRIEAAVGALRDLVEKGFHPRGPLVRIPELADFLSRPEVVELLSSR